MFKFFVFKFCFISLLLNQQSYAQCPNPTILFTEDFETTPIIGAVTSVIYGQGNWTNAAYTLSGSAHGWFNVVNNVGNVDFYDRQVSNLCVGTDIDATLWTRHSYGSTNVTYSLIDDFGVAIASTTLNLTTIYQQITLSATVTTSNIRLVMHINSTGGNGNDIIVEDIVMNQCSNFPTEQLNHAICNDLNPVDLSTLFSANIPSGGTWTGPSLLSNDSLGTYNPAINTPGLYAYTPPNGATCASVLSSTINVNFIGEFSLGNDTTLCSGSNITLSAPASFNTYSWNTAAPTQNITVNTAGIYFVDATFNSTPNCIISDTLIVSIQIPTQTLTVTPPVCDQDANGSIAVDNPEATEYSIDNGTTWQVDSFFVNLPNGTYTVCSRSDLGCTVCENILFDTPPVTISVSADTIICENGTANLTANANGGNFFNFNWDFTSNLNATQTINPLTSGTYGVVAENEFGCTSTTENITVTILPPLSGIVTPSISLCDGDSGILLAEVSGGSGIDYTFNWSTGDTQTGPNMHSINVSPNVSNTINVTLSDNCETTPITLAADVIIHPLPQPQFLLDELTYCEPAEVTITDMTNNVTVQNVDWTVNGNQVFLNQTSITTDPLFAGNYDIVMNVTSDQGCFYSETFPNSIIVEAPPVSNFSNNPDPVTMFNTSVTFSENANGAVAYQWILPGATPSFSNVENPTVVYPDGIADEYQATLIVTSSSGCTDTLTKKITVYPELIIYAPNTFTPDADEFNPTWKVFMQGIDVYDFSLTLYNRWGEVIWESKNIDIPWDGTYDGQQVKTGVYLWRVNAKDLLTDKTYEFNGYVNVLK